MLGLPLAKGMEVEILDQSPRLDETNSSRLPVSQGLRSYK